MIIYKITINMQLLIDLIFVFILLFGSSGTAFKAALLQMWNDDDINHVVLFFVAFNLFKLEFERFVGTGAVN